jgi:8-oxo-dGTP diphosphatase
MSSKTSKMPRIRLGGVVVQRGKILLVKHKRNDREYYLLPGGGLEWGETCAQGLNREFEEELSVQVKVGPLLMVNESIEPHGRRHILNLTFQARICGGTLNVNSDYRLKGVGWFDRKSFQKLIFYPEIRREILHAWKNKFKPQAKLIATPWT